MKIEVRSQEAQDRWWDRQIKSSQASCWDLKPPIIVKLPARDKLLVIEDPPLTPVLDTDINQYR